MLRHGLILFAVAVIFLGGCATPKQRLEQQGPVSDVSVYGSEQSDDTAVFDDDFNSDFDDWDAPGILISDPLEPLNRGMFWVNDKLYFYLFKPLARGYRAVVPRPARVSVGNFFLNVATPVRAGNALLQLKFTNAGTEVYRFIVNTSIGVGGLFDPAASVAGVRRVPADFGQTLGSYGFGHGFYLVLPVVGPSSLRDGAGTFVDSFADPFRYTSLETMELVLIRMFDATNRLSLDRDSYEGIIRDSLDPYLFVRDAYAQRRRAQVGEGVFNMNIFQAPVFDQEFFSPLEWFRLELK